MHAMASKRRPHDVLILTNDVPSGWIFSLIRCVSPTRELDRETHLTPCRIDAPQSTRCQATVDFGALSFLPLHFDFSTTKCDGQLIATFTIPAEVPNGEADVMW